MLPELVKKLIAVIQDLIKALQSYGAQQVPNRFWTKEQAAQYFHCSEKTIERMMNTGLKYYGLTGSPLFLQSDLDEFAEQFKQVRAA